MDATALRTEPTERQFTVMIVRLARLHGWLVAHFRPAMNRRGKWSTAIQGDVGFPDLILIHPRRGKALAIELKVRGRKPEPDQVRWLAAFAQAGVESAVWMPEQWDQIAATLAE